MNPAAVSDALGANLAAAERHLARFRSATLPHFIAGRPDDGDGRAFDNLNPADNTVLCRVAAGGPAEIDRAARAAADAFPAWRDLAGSVRRDILHQVADRIEARAGELALVESVDSGQPIR